MSFTNLNQNLNCCQIVERSFFKKKAGIDHYVGFCTIIHIISVLVWFGLVLSSKSGHVDFVIWSYWWNMFVDMRSYPVFIILAYSSGFSLFFDAPLHLHCKSKHFTCFFHVSYEYVQLQVCWMDLMLIQLSSSVDGKMHRMNEWITIGRKWFLSITFPTVSKNLNHVRNINLTYQRTWTIRFSKC